MPLPFPNILPTQSSSVTTTPSIVETKYGDGYSERMSNGINTDLEKWNLTFTVTTLDNNTINAFLKARGGWDMFLWTNPITNISGSYICKSWNTTLLSGGWYNIKTVFEEVTTI